MSGASNLFIDAALSLARGGFYVFPCRVKGKAPVTPNGWKDATRDEARIRDWWGDGARLNIGVACEPSRIAVVDIDAKHGADPRAIIPELDLEGYPCVKTGTAPEPSDDKPNSLTGEGGAQVYTRAADLPTVDNIVSGVEIRGRGAYVIAPPSIHPCGDPS